MELTAVTIVTLLNSTDTLNYNHIVMPAGVPQDLMLGPLGFFLSFASTVRHSLKSFCPTLVVYGLTWLH